MIAFGRKNAFAACSIGALILASPRLLHAPSPATVVVEGGLLLFKLPICPFLWLLPAPPPGNLGDLYSFFAC
jgi:hypothetical protein